MTLYYVVTIFFLLLNGASSFKGSSKSISTVRVMMMSKNVAVIGVAGGAAETISCRLAEKGFKVSTLLDQKPLSPVLYSLCQSGSVRLFTGDLEQIPNINSVLDSQNIILVGDDGDDKLRGGGNNENIGFTFLSKSVKFLPPSATGIIVSVGAEVDDRSRSSVFGFKGSLDLKSWCAEKNKPFSLFRYGKLIGGIPGADPLPFVSLPLTEPELDPSYILRSVVLSDPSVNKYAASEVCTRDALAEATTQLVERDLSVESLVVSIAGAPPTGKEWGKLFNRFTVKGNVEIFRIDFGSINKPQALLNWVADVWFPQALIDADAATILSGARPVRALKKSDNGVVQLVWEDIQPDLTVRSISGVEIRITQGDAPGLSVVRLSDGALPGEAQLMDKLIEGVNKNVYKKQFCVPV